jgi:predicted nucleic acid-binding protein
MPAVMLDANLLVLLIVGMTSREYIERHRHLRAYNEADLDLLLESIAPMSPVVVTSNVLTEVSNLASQIAEPARAQIAETFRKFAGLVEERHVESRHAVEHPDFPRLWLTDAGILDELAGAHVLFTADLDLYLEASRRGYAAVNFNYLRDL